MSVLAVHPLSHSGLAARIGHALRRFGEAFLVARRMSVYQALEHEELLRKWRKESRYLLD